MAQSVATNGAVLIAHEATIQTAQVEIQVLKVGKKQVTMGLFRQLPLVPLVTTTTVEIALQGQPWGMVHDWWESDGTPAWRRDEPRLHVVWQAGDRLYRAIVFARPDPALLAVWEREVRHYMTDIFLVGLLSVPDTSRLWFPEHANQGVQMQGRRLTISLVDNVWRAVNAYCRNRTSALAWARQQALDGYAEVLQQRGIDADSLPALEAALQHFQERERSYRQRWDAFYRGL